MPREILRRQRPITSLPASPARAPIAVKKGSHSRRFWWSKKTETKEEFNTVAASEVVKKQSRSKVHWIVKVPQSPLHSTLQQPSIRRNCWCQRFSRLFVPATVHGTLQLKSPRRSPSAVKKVLGRRVHE